MSRLHPIKGADRLIEAFIKIRHQIKDAVLIMAGPDEFHIQENFCERVTALGMQESILFPGMISGNLKKHLLARADLFCLPSDAEGFSMAILEALASQTAVMISPGCHFPEVEKAGCGVVVENEVDKIAKTLCSLINNKEQLLLMGKNGRNLVTNYYDWNGIANKYVEVYQEGLARQRKLLNVRSLE
jgi:glycosyltransferase involved in cell wall biosynthesis